jgi:arsenate reductase (glutaredoxin)
MIQVFGTNKCKGTKAAERFFAERGLKIQRIDLASKGMAKGELERVAKAVGGIVALLDREGARAKAKGLHVLSVDQERVKQMLLDDALLLRTPIVARGSVAAVGADEATWKRLAEAEKQGA